MLKHNYTPNFPIYGRYCCIFIVSCSFFILEYEYVQVLTLGMLSLLHTPSDNNLSLISHAKMLGHSLLNSAILFTTGVVATLGLDPPIALGLMDPVS